uniref:Uncharacterized protein n=1 Tax=Caenorhabditis tropicalis TaxID=1561998 RepID=A0A1I7UR55_9PELO
MTEKSPEFVLFSDQLLVIAEPQSHSSKLVIQLKCERDSRTTSCMKGSGSSIEKRQNSNTLHITMSSS